MNTACSKNGIIVALATPYGKSAIAVIRMSGKDSKALAERFLKNKLKAGKIKYNVFTSGDFTENLMAAYFKAPKTYTGEDIVELYPHGNTLIIDSIIKALIGGGARAAERGEFTERAFKSGKLDLTECEALADIIDAETPEQLNYGNARYNGINSLKDVELFLNRALSTIEAVIHYSDELEDGETDERLLGDVYGALDEITARLETEIKGYAGGKIIKDGFKVALVGKPNVGKSTLLNALLGEDRAIVTDVAGTTRDTIDGSYVYKHRKFTVTDTAGLNDSTHDEVEKIGIERTKTAAKEADAVIFVTESVKTDIIPDFGKPIITVLNKSDGVKDADTDYQTATEDGKLKVSAKYKINITALKERIYDLCPKEVSGICNHRQFDCVRRCLDAVNSAKAESKKADGLELVAAALYEGYSAITELFGEAADEKVISSVFERFCVGK
ncbi:MAG: tRNA uridine-5-carboxymethylaminomethyl(34) synthesis GTPase MnmE [Clostridiales bacterium]|nr:tRNA uridine-5-carboxymethylaminomethyl(34) synthesis GTPase MnmE [Clostridiales bacterium]